MRKEDRILCLLAQPHPSLRSASLKIRNPLLQYHVLSVHLKLTISVFHSHCCPLTQALATSCLDSCFDLLKWCPFPATRWELLESRTCSFVMSPQCLAWLGLLHIDAYYMFFNWMTLLIYKSRDFCFNLKTKRFWVCVASAFNFS